MTEDTVKLDESVSASVSLLVDVATESLAESVSAEITNVKLVLSLPLLSEFVDVLDRDRLVVVGTLSVEDERVETRLFGILIHLRYFLSSVLADRNALGLSCLLLSDNDTLLVKNILPFKMAHVTCSESETERHKTVESPNVLTIFSQTFDKSLELIVVKIVGCGKRTLFAHNFNSLMFMLQRYGKKVKQNNNFEILT